MNSQTWLIRLRGVQLSVLLALVQDRFGVHTAVELAAIVGYSRRHVSKALDVLEREGWVYRVHRTGWRCSVSAVEFVHDLFTAGDTLRQGNKRVHSTYPNGTLSENGRPAEEAQSTVGLHSTLQKVTLDLHDHDHDDDEVEIVDYRVLRLEEIGFQDARRWLNGQDGRLVELWLDWAADLDQDGRSRFKNLGGFIRKKVVQGERPSLGRVGNRTPLSMIGRVKR